MSRQTVRAAIGSTLAEALARDERVVLLGEGLGSRGGRFGVACGLQARFGAERVIDLPPGLAGGAVGLAVGLALNGTRPILELPSAERACAAIDQIVYEAAWMRYRSAGDWGCPLVLRVPYGAVPRQGPYGSQNVEALLARQPGLVVVAPTTPADAAGLLHSALAWPDPVVLLEHRQLYDVAGEVPEQVQPLSFGQAAVRRQGDALSVFTYGAAVALCLGAAERLAAAGVEVQVIDLRTLLPLDRAAILEAMQRTGKALIVHEDQSTLGLGAEIAALLAAAGFESLDGPVTRMAGPDLPAGPFRAALYTAWALNVERVAEAMADLARY